MIFFSPKLTFLFCLIAGIKKDRVNDIAKFWLQHGQTRPENRGGARNIGEKTEQRKE